MSASWSRPTSLPKNIRGTTSASRKKHGRRSAPRLAGMAHPPAGALSRLDHPVDAGAGARPGAAAIVDRDAAALLPPLVLPHHRAAGAPDRASDSRPTGAVRRQPRLLSRHYGAE